MNTNWKDTITKYSARALATREAPLLLKEAAWKLIKFVARCGHSNPISFVLRPLASHPYLRSGVGIVIAILAITSTLWGPVVLPSFAGPNTGGQIELVVLPVGEANLTTIQSVQIPLENYRLSQGYKLFHPGLDMATAIGEPIRPVMAGQVIKVQRDRGGYGNHVVVAHNNGYESLYAHLSKIEVTEGEEIDTNTEIGKVGSTGRSTGPHLHLEIRESGRLVNPKTLLEIK